MSPGAYTLTVLLSLPVLFGIAAASATAQQVQIQFGAPAQAASHASKIQLVTDRVAARGMKRAQERIAAGEFAQAITFLDSMLGRKEDLFLEVGEEGRAAGLKETARQIIRDLPPEGRRAYEASFGPVAQRLLVDAVQSGDAAALTNVASRYFYTPAGYEAALLVAMDQADAGHHFAAALNYQKLLETPEAVQRFDPELSIRAAACWLAAGDEARAQAIIDQLVARGQQTIEVAGRQRRIDDTVESLAWLREVVGQPVVLETSHQDEWLAYRGNAARNGHSDGGLPHMRVRWQVRLLGHPTLETLFDNFRSDLIREGAMVPVASNPLAAGDYILTRTPQGLLAVDFRTGKRMWRSEPKQEPELLQLIQAGGSPEGGGNPEAARAFARRIWEDYLYGITSSDGARVYMIRDIPMPSAQDYEFTPFMAAPQGEPAAPYNRLSAYELATQGKLIWEVDGAAATGELAGAFFLGAPLPVGESLYVLAEIKGAIHLIVLDRTNGELQWQQPLANLEVSVQVDMQRRLQAAMPSYEAGMLVCPTNAGVVLGVDLAKRSLAWAYQYEAAESPETHYRGRGDDAWGQFSRRWLDSAVTIVGDRVLLTPPDSDRLHAVDLRTGKPLWKQKRGEMNRLAAVWNDRVLLTGNHKLRALNVGDGKPAWSSDLALPPAAVPSGAGFLSDGKYYLPLTTAEVIAVDLASGKVAGRAVSRDGVALGNLICHRGAVISQNGMFLDCYDQVDVLRRSSEQRLAQQPSDVDALRTLGEIAYNEGRLSDAISLLERAYRAGSDEVMVHEVLAECLVAALDEDFAAYRQHLSLLKQLGGDGAAQQMVILRIEAQGRLLEGDPLASTAACLQLYQISRGAEDVLQIGRAHEAAVGAWVQSQLALIWEQADADQRKQIESQIQAELDKLGESPSGDELARALQFFGSLPLAEPLKLARTRELFALGDALAAQQLLLDLEKSSDPAIRAEAIARIAVQLHKASLHPLAAEYDAQLSGPLADVKCLDGATGRELLEKWSTAAAVAAMAPWPAGKVEIREMPVSGDRAARGHVFGWNIRFERVDSILGLTTAELSGRGNELAMHDQYGREFFRANFESDARIYGRYPGLSMYAVGRGNLIVTSLGRQMVAFNTLAAANSAERAQLWRINLGSNLEYQRAFYGNAAGGRGDRPGSFRAPRAVDEEKWIGVIGPVTAQGVIFQDQRRLLCVDPITGEVRWSRSDVPQGCDLFGDDRYVFAVPYGAAKARIYSAIDGREAGRADVPPWREQVVAYGRQLICWKAAGDKTELSSLDPLSGDTAWRHEFSSNAKIDVDQGRYVAVVEPRGRAVVIDAADGKLCVDQSVPATPKVDDVHLAVGRQTFFIAAKHPFVGNAARQVQALQMLDSQVIDGHLYLFDRDSGQMRWNRPVEVAQQALLLSQPVDLPIIVFAAQVNSNDDGNARRPNSKVLILDKATGRTLYQRDDLPPGGNYCIARVVDAASRQAAVEMAGRTILLQFTDGRRPPEPPALAEVESAGNKGAGGLMGIIFGLGR